jgi:hypothetical protein
MTKGWVCVGLEEQHASCGPEAVCRLGAPGEAASAGWKQRLSLFAGRQKQRWTELMWPRRRYAALPWSGGGRGGSSGGGQRAACCALPGCSLAFRKVPKKGAAATIVAAAAMLPLPPLHCCHGFLRAASAGKCLPGGR